MTTPSQLQDLLSKYYFFRGVLFAAASIALIQNIFGMEYWEALRAVRALIASWNLVPIFIANLLPKHILGVPMLKDAAAIGNVLIIVGLGQLNEFSINSAGERKSAERSGIRMIAFVVSASKVSAVLIFLLALLIVSLARLISPGAGIEAMTHFVAKGLFYTALAALSVYVLSAAAFCLIVLENFRRGFLAVLGFLIAIEALYLARLPGVSGFINSEACELLEIPPSDC